MEKEFNPKGCPKIKFESSIQKNFGFIPLFTKVYLDLQNGQNSGKPIFMTPPYLTDASIPLTPAFNHYGGLLFIQHYLSYKAMPGGIKEAEQAAKKLKFNYRIMNNCDDSNFDFSGFDLGPSFIPSKEVVYFITIIDII